MPEVRCPTCQTVVDPKQTAFMPFCSLRCKQIDLGRWLNEEIGLPVESEDEPERQPQQSDNDL